MKNIGILHYQVGRMDGVSLEIEKWKRVLEALGHRVYFAAGDLSTEEGTLIEEMYHLRPEVVRLYRSTFESLDGYPTEAAYRAELWRLASVLEEKLKAFVEEKEIDLLIPENVWSVAVNPSLSIALTRVIREMQVQALAHHHDFYWEREHGVALSCSTAVEMADKYLPPRDPLARHVVINSLAQQELAARKGIPAGIVPNVFDFEAPPWRLDDYNRDFRARIGLGPSDVLILQATRITPRKGIELAADFVQVLDTDRYRAQLEAQGLYDGRPFGPENRIVLVIAGYARDDLTGDYVDRLKARIAQTGIEALFIEDLIEGRRQTRGGEKVYSLWDAYVFADFVTYPSLDEGWGNQFLEAVYARMPLLLFEYPVYRADIKPKGFRTVSLGADLEGEDAQGLAQVTPEKLEAAAEEAVALLTNRQQRQAMVDHNFELGRRHFSLQTLETCLEQLVGDGHGAATATSDAAQQAIEVMPD
ncbi:MAG: glycosyl transferase family 1 [Anaerolineae bacterium]|jgi:glycosyltransferase involved in cell wall biosynthesis